MGDIMKDFYKKKDYLYFIFTFVLLSIIHFPLISKNIISADILLNNYFYKGYSWEISLGRFGLFVVGLFKSFLTIPHIDFFFSSLIICFIIYFLFKLFKIDKPFNRIIFILIFVLCPFTSVTLTFNYCSIAYFLAFLCGVLSLYLFYNIKNKYLRIIIPIILIVTSLSMYQAYLSLIVTLYVIYHITLVLKNNINYKDCFKYLGLIIVGVISYFVLMKISLYVFNIDMSSYSNADKVGISTLLNIPNKLIDSYILFFEFFFKNSIVKNTFMYNHLIYLCLFIAIIFSTIYYFIKNKIYYKNIILVSLLLLLLPVFLNFVLFVINDSKLQLLMSSSYLIIPLYVLSICDFKKINYVYLVLCFFLLRNYCIQDQATYLSLENTFNKYDTIISTAINNNINNLDKSFAIIGSLKNKNINEISNVNKYNYGYIADYDLFWEEYNLRSLAFKRFVYEYYGLEVYFCDEEVYNDILNYKNNDIVYNYNDVVVINFNNYK